MGSFSKLTYHVVFSTKFRSPSIHGRFEERMYEYIGGVIRSRKGHLIQVGSVEDHVHLLANFPANISVSDMVRDLKSKSSKWIHEMVEATAADKKFAWQIGDGAFTVSYSNVDAVKSYIENQKEHHRKKTFTEE